MDSINFPTLEIAILKDAILKHLSMLNQDSKISSVELWDILKPKDTAYKIFQEYLSELDEADMVINTDVSKSESLVCITDKGRKFLSQGGYFELAKVELQTSFEEALREERQEDKLKLEIESLRSGMEHNRKTRIKTNIALIISGLTLVYLLIKDLILKVLF